MNTAIESGLAKDRATELKDRLESEQERLKIMTESVKEQVQLQQGQVERMRGIANFQQSRVASMRVIAGADGVVQELPLELGQWVTPGTVLAKVVQPERLKAELRIPETQARDIQLGQRAEVDTRNGVVEGVVARIAPSASQGTVKVEVSLTGELPKGARPDLTVEGTVELERLRASGLSLAAAYTLSRTRDNRMLGLTGDPFDQLSPFPTDVPGNEWVEGRSDLDIPHRVRLWGAYTFPGRLGLTVAARYRFRSGFPYTPGFQPGVDVNGDGSGRNDPAFIDPTIPGMDAVIADNSCLTDQSGNFAERNSCRDPNDHALDLHLSLGLPVGSLKGRVELSVDAFNVVSSSTGIRDHALVLVDPAGTLTTDPQGNVTLPLVANPRFGSLISRRGDYRFVRFGLRFGY